MPPAFEGIAFEYAAFEANNPDASVIEAAMLSAGAATAIAASQATIDAAAAAAGAATAIAVAELLTAVDGAMGAGGVATAVAVGDSEIIIPATPVSNAPAGGGGATQIPGVAPRVKIRKPKVHTIRYGEWPEEPNPDEIERRERKELLDLFKSAREEVGEIPEDDEERALMLILALAA